MLKNNKGITGTDIVISVIAIILFTSTILALMSNIKLENLKIKSKLIADVYLVETLENIGIAKYDEIVPENVDNLIPNMSENFEAKIEIIKVNEEVDTEKTEDILKKVTVKILYRVGNKKYEEIAQRLKIKEI